jgi:hypothetical protein
MNQDRTENQLLELERRYWQAMQDRDVKTAVSLTEFPCIIAGASGTSSVEQKDFERMLQHAPYRIQKVEIDPDAKIRMLKDDVAIIAYNVHEELTVDGKKVELDASDASTWVKRNGRWLCALHTEALSGDAFGRKRPASAE